MFNEDSVVGKMRSGRAPELTQLGNRVGKKFEKDASKYFKIGHTMTLRSLKDGIPGALVSMSRKYTVLSQTFGRVFDTDLRTHQYIEILSPDKKTMTTFGLWTENINKKPVVFFNSPDEGHLKATNAINKSNDPRKRAAMMRSFRMSGDFFMYKGNVVPRGPKLSNSVKVNQTHVDLFQYMINSARMNRTPGLNSPFRVRNGTGVYAGSKEITVFPPNLRYEKMCHLNPSTRKRNMNCKTSSEKFMRDPNEFYLDLAYAEEVRYSPQSILYRTTGMMDPNISYLGRWNSMIPTFGSTQSTALPLPPMSAKLASFIEPKVDTAARVTRSRGQKRVRPTSSRSPRPMKRAR
mgnify:CR=1 FL=1